MVCTNTFIESSLRASMPSQRTCSSWFPISISGAIVCPVSWVKWNNASWNANFQDGSSENQWVDLSEFSSASFLSWLNHKLFFPFLFVFISCLFPTPLLVRSFEKVECLLGDASLEFTAMKWCWEILVSFISRTESRSCGVLFADGDSAQKETGITSSYYLAIFLTSQCAQFPPATSSN